MIFINIKCQWDFIRGKTRSSTLRLSRPTYGRRESVLKRTAIDYVVCSTQTGIRLNRVHYINESHPFSKHAFIETVNTTTVHKAYPAGTIRWINVEMKFITTSRRYFNHISTLFQCQMPAGYDTRSDMSHTPCWMRQNLRMSDRVSPPKTPRDTIRQSCKKNRTCSIFIRLQPTLSNWQINQMTGICTRGYVYVFVCMSTC